MLISLPFKKKSSKSRIPSVDKSQIAQKWIEIEHLTGLGGESNGKNAIMEADKLLDLSLKAMGVEGQTLAERLKNGRNLFSYEGYNSAWAGHKVRNQIAHEMGFDLLHHQVVEAVNNFKLALKDLGVI